MSILVMATIDSCNYRIVRLTIQIIGIFKKFLIDLDFFITNLETECLYCTFLYCLLFYNI